MSYTEPWQKLRPGVGLGARAPLPKPSLGQGTAGGHGWREQVFLPQTASPRPLGGVTPQPAFVWKPLESTQSCEQADSGSSGGDQGAS